MIRLFLFIFSLLILCIFSLAPLLNLLSLTQFQNFVDVFEHSSIVKAILNTIAVGISVSILSVIIGLPLAWLFSRTNIPYARNWKSLFSLPYAIPPYIGAIGWIILANPNSGLIHRLTGVSWLNIYSFFGLVWIETSFLFTFIFMNCFASLQRMDSSLEEAARLSGASPLKVFYQITLPILKSSILSGILLCFLATAASFGVPALIGTPARIYLLTTQIYTYQRMGTQNGIQQAVALSSILMIGSIILLSLQAYLSRRSNYAMVSGKSSRVSLVDLGPFKNIVLLGVILFWILIFVFPIVGIGISAFSEIQGVLSFSNFSWVNFERVLFQTEETSRALSHSLVLGSAAATATVLMAIVLSFIQTKTRLPGRRLIDLIAAIPFSTPGTVVALALILAFSHGVFGVGPSLYNTLFLIGIAYAVKYLSLSLKTLNDGYGQIHDSLIEASRVSGATWTQSFRTIIIPLLKPSIMAGWILVFMPVLSELTMTLLLTGPGLETIGTLIFQLQDYSDIGGGGAAVLSLMIIITVLGLNFVTKKLSKGKYGL